MTSLFIAPRQFTVDAAGSPYPGMQVFFYTAGTSIAQPVYQDILLTVPHSQPIIADANGILPPIYLNAGLPTNYRVVFRDADGALIPGYDIDNVPRGSSGGGGGGGPVGDLVQLLRLQSTAQAFTFNASGVASPGGQTIQFTATLQNLSGVVTWSTTPTVPLSITGNSASLLVDDFGANPSVRVRAQIGAGPSAPYDEITIYRLQSGGIDSIVGFLTNEAHTLAADSAGVVSNFVGADGVFNVFSGVTLVNLSSTYSVSATSGCTVSINTANNTPNAGQPKGYYRVLTATADQAYADFTADYNGVTITKRMSIAKSRQGIQGLQGIPGAGTPGSNGQRGPGPFRVDVLESGTGFAISSADVLVWRTGPMTNGLAQEAGAAIIAKASDARVQTSDTLLMVDSTNNQAATRIYTGPTTDNYLTITSAMWSTPVTQFIDGSLIVNGTVGAAALAVASLSAINANLGLILAGLMRFTSGANRLEVGIDGGFQLWAGTGTKNTTNANFYIDENGIAYFRGIVASGSTLPQLPAFSANIAAGSLNSTGASGTRSYGSRTVTVSGGRTPYIYSWNLTNIQSTTDPPGAISMRLTGATNTDTIGVSGYAVNEQILGRATCTVVDADNRVASASFQIIATHGTPP